MDRNCNTNEDEGPNRHRAGDDGEFDNPPRRKKKKAGNGLLIGLTTMGGVLVIGLVIMLIWPSRGGLEKEIVGKWKYDNNKKIRTKATTIADFQPNGKAIVETVTSMNYGIDQIFDLPYSLDYRINGDILEILDREGIEKKYKVEIREDEMTWTFAGNLDQGRDTPTTLIWKRIK